MNIYLKKKRNDKEVKYDKKSLLVSQNLKDIEVIMYWNKYI